jgi:hypothetical protein
MLLYQAAASRVARVAGVASSRDPALTSVLSLMRHDKVWLGISLLFPTGHWKLGHTPVLFTVNQFVMLLSFSLFTFIRNSQVSNMCEVTYRSAICVKLPTGQQHVKLLSGQQHVWSYLQVSNMCEVTYRSAACVKLLTGQQHVWSYLQMYSSPTVTYVCSREDWICFRCRTCQLLANNVWSAGWNECAYIMRHYMTSFMMQYMTFNQFIGLSLCCKGIYRLVNSLAFAS